jgi:hypothetical protein
MKIIEEKKDKFISIEEYAKKWNLKMDDQYLYAYRNHDKRNNGMYFSNIGYEKGILYHDWHCDINPLNENSYGFGIWPEGNTKICVPIDKWGCAVFNSINGKARVWAFEIIN